MTGELWINGDDAYTTWGIITSSTTLSELMTPAGQKKLVENSSRLEHGKRVIATQETARKADRDITLNIQMVAGNEEDFFANYAAFCDDVLAKGRFEIHTKYQPDVIYRLDYVSCQQFSEFMRGIAKFALRCNEPDPTDRGLLSIH